MTKEELQGYYDRLHVLYLEGYKIDYNHQNNKINTKDDDKKLAHHISNVSTSLNSKKDIYDLVLEKGFNKRKDDEKAFFSHDLLDSRRHIDTLDQFLKKLQTIIDEF